MARKKQHNLTEDLKALSASLDAVEKLMERTKVLFEQYFMGIQKIAPSQLHRDIERKIRELTQIHIRNTALRFRLTNVTQKYGVYNTYWRRTLRQIEQGKYIRDIARVQRRAKRRGEDVPEEILAAMPKRMRDRVRRDRELLAKREARAAQDVGADVGAAPADDAPQQVRSQRAHAHSVDADMLNDDFDIDALFRNLTSEAEDAISALEEPSAPPPSAPPPSAANRRPAGPPPAISPLFTNGVPKNVASETDTTQPFPHRMGSVKPLAPLPNRPRPKQSRRPTPPPPPDQRAQAPQRQRAPSVPPPIPTKAANPPRRRRAPSAPPPPPPDATRRNRPPRARTAPPVAGAGSRPPAPPRRPARPPVAASKNLPPGMTEAKTRALYQRYLNARRQVGKSTDIRYNDLVKTLNKQAPSLLKQHKAKAVEFDVMVKGGKVILKAMPKKKS